CDTGRSPCRLRRAGRTGAAHRRSSSPCADRTLAGPGSTPRSTRPPPAVPRATPPATLRSPSATPSPVRALPMKSSSPRTRASSLRSRECTDPAAQSRLAAKSPSLLRELSERADTYTNVHYQCQSEEMEEKWKEQEVRGFVEKNDVSHYLGDFLER